jgi:hypothetical protein
MSIIGGSQRNQCFSKSVWRKRLDGRAAAILQRLDSGAKLMWSDSEGRYRIEMGGYREDAVIQRSLDKLLRLNCVKRDPGSVLQYSISSIGKRMLFKHISGKALVSRHTSG